MKWKISDIVGILAIVGCFSMISMGKDSTVLAVLLIVIGFYFGQNVDISHGGKGR